MSKQFLPGETGLWEIEIAAASFTCKYHALIET